MLKFWIRDPMGITTLWLWTLRGIKITSTTILISPMDPILIYSPVPSHQPVVFYSFTFSASRPDLLVSLALRPLLCSHCPFTKMKKVKKFSSSWNKMSLEVS